MTTIKTATSENTLVDFFDKQLKLWPAARERFEDLKKVKTRQVGNLLLQYNPARIRSTGASIDKAVLAKRPCFLCAANRPAEQLTLDLGMAELLVNPYPILPKHFTIPLQKHQPQKLELLEGYISMLLRLDPSLMVFYNGPHCGASAPDHAHLQAGTSGLLPVQKMWRNDVEWIKEDEENKTMIGLVKGYACPIIVVKGDAPIVSLPKVGDDVNVISWREDKEQIALIFLRSKHRPDCYARGVMVSPGALDMGGLIITPQEEDFNNLDADTASGILQEVSMTETEVRKIISKI